MPFFLLRRLNKANKTFVSFLTFVFDKIFFKHSYLIKFSNNIHHLKIRKNDSYFAFCFEPIWLFKLSASSLYFWKRHWLSIKRISILWVIWWQKNNWFIYLELYYLNKCTQFKVQVLRLKYVVLNVVLHLDALVKINKQKNFFFSNQKLLNKNILKGFTYVSSSKTCFLKSSISSSSRSSSIGSMNFFLHSAFEIY